jgi:hypothetical protein
VFVGGHYADAVGVEVYEGEDGDLRGVCVEEAEELAGLDVWVAFCLKLGSARVRTAVGWQFTVISMPFPAGESFQY